MNKKQYISEIRDDNFLPDGLKKVIINRVKKMSDKEFQKYLKEKKNNKIPTVLDDREQWEVVAFA